MNKSVATPLITLSAFVTSCTMGNKIGRTPDVPETKAPTKGQIITVMDDNGRNDWEFEPDFRDNSYYSKPMHVDKNTTVRFRYDNDKKTFFAQNIVPDAQKQNYASIPGEKEIKEAEFRGVANTELLNTSLDKAKQKQMRIVKNQKQ